MKIRIFLPIALLLLGFHETLAQTTAFTYQGKLTDNGTPASGNYDLTFKLFDTATVGSGVQQGTTLSLTNVVVSGGVFTVTLDFGACGSCFNGAARFLEVSVKPTSGSTFTTLAPRQAVTANPYAIKSLSATSADGLSVTCVSCVTSSQIQSVNGSAVSGAIPVSSVPAGSASYIQNSTNQQTASNFNISGDGTAGGTLSGNIVNATTQYNIGGLRVLAVSGAGTFVNSNTFAGIGAGVSTSPTDGVFNSFFGYNAGFSNTTGEANAFFGYNAGFSNTDAINNAFFGYYAGFSNTTGSANSFFGSGAGDANTTGNRNTFVGFAAGRLNSTASYNAFFGYHSGFGNGVGTGNTFIGTLADFNTINNPTGDNNTLLGYSTHVISGVSNATAIGANATVTQSNSLVLGNGVNVGIGNSAPIARLHVIAGSANAQDNTARFEAPGIGPNTSHIHYGTLGDWYIRSAASTGSVILQDSGGNVGIGIAAPADKLVVGGIIRVATLGAAGSTTLCRNSTFQISTCSSSRRYKTNIADWSSGLILLNRLRPVTFDWKESKMHDLGLVAEEVAEVEPLLVTHNDKGEIEGVKYDRLGVVLVNAIKEQQAQIERQQSQLEKQQAEIESLKKLVSSFHPKARRRN